jgi:hypothetical protein
MSTCEKCWGDAWIRSLSSMRSQWECYLELVEERKGNPCSPRDQAGQFWDEDLKRDKRNAEKRREVNGYLDFDIEKGRYFWHDTKPKNSREIANTRNDKGLKI